MCDTCGTYFMSVFDDRAEQWVAVKLDVKANYVFLDRFPSKIEAVSLCRQLHADHIDNFMKFAGFKECAAL